VPLTTKHQLCRNIKNLAFAESYLDYHSFYPRCFDLSDPLEFEDFIEEFKYSYAESLLK